MTYQRIKTGALGEKLAAEFLKKRGYKILETNVQTSLGEIDLLARHKNDIVAVEVKTKSGEDFGAGFEMVDFFKRRKLLGLAHLLEARYPKATIRIDIVSVNITTDPPDIKHFTSAVEE